MMGLLSFFLFMTPFLYLCEWYVVVFSLLCCFFNLFFSSFGDGFSMISYGYGIDVLSFSLIMLSFWIVILMYVSSFGLYSSSVFVMEFVFVVFILLMVLFLSFSTLSLFLFYIFFEFSLIPTLLLIFGWGYQPERLGAGYSLIFYTLFFSLPLLLGIFYIYFYCFSMFFLLISKGGGLFFYLSMVMAFLVSMPLIFIHFWLPKAHVEAPISGSMILAGVLLKLGGYGILRVFNYVSFFEYNFIFVCLSLFGMFLVGFVCLFQFDIKSLIAYSSVSHMGMVICGLMSINYWGVVGSLVLMIGHGLCSSGLFCLANVVYERSGSRLLILNKGLIVFMPSMTMFWFFMSINNMASPISLNLLGEIFLINSLVCWDSFSIVFLFFSSFLSCVYSIYLYSYLNHGLVSSLIFSGSSGYFLEFMLIFMHWFPLNFLFLKFDVFFLV